eukprot:scaffold16589_cov228-Skeletonema_marinoi.AAC.2
MRSNMQVKFALHQIILDNSIQVVFVMCTLPFYVTEITYLRYKRALKLAKLLTVGHPKMVPKMVPKRVIFSAIVWRVLMGSVIVVATASTRASCGHD